MKLKRKSCFIILFLLLNILSFKNVYAAPALDCVALGEALDDIKNVFNFCKIVVPILVIGLSIFDFIKAVTGKDEKDMKEASKKLTKRIILGILFFFLPVLLNVFLDLLGTNSTVCV